jgi:UDP-N-acetylmuramoyl-L-alanyl-D-glutamate--2,6-diaminopimelate ligase
MLSHLSGSRPLTLRQLIPDGKFYGASDPIVVTCSDTVQRIVTGDVYFACINADGDGHDDILRAVELGAIAVVTERLVVTSVPVVVVTDSRRAFALACHQLFGLPSQSLTTTAVTGTDGKTTVAMLIESVLLNAGRDVTSRTSLGIRAPAGYAQRQTTPSAAELVGWLAESIRWGVSNVILEVDSRDVVSRRSTGTQFDHLVFTNISPAHLQLHRNAENYHRTLLGLIDQLKPNGVVIANVDDPVLRDILPKLEAPSLTYSMTDDTADIRATLLERHRGEQTFLLEVGHRSALVRTRIIGDQHIRNCMAATGIGLIQEIDLATIVAGLEKLERLNGRLDRVECGQPFGVFVEHHVTPTRLAAALATLRSVTTGKLWCLYGPQTTRDDCQLAAMGRVIEVAADHCILTGATHETRGTLPLLHDVLDGMKHVGRPRIIPSRSRAVRWVLDEIGDDDTVLLIGAPITACPVEACGQEDDRQLVEQHLREISDDAPVILPFPTAP